MSQQPRPAAGIDRRSFGLGLAGTLAMASDAGAQPGTAPAPPIWGPLRPGRFGAAFSVRWLRDPSRPSQDGSAAGRAVQVAFWQTARFGSGAAMRIGDYAERLGARDRSTPAGWPLGARAQMALSLSPGLPVGGEADLGRHAVYARARAMPAADGAPVVLLAQGLFFDSPLHQFLLAEYLASHGYRVAAPALSGALTVVARLTAADVEAQVRDLEFVRGALSFGAVPFAVAGWDMGGMAALLFAARNPDTRALVALDSGVTAPGLIRDFLTADLTALRAPILIGTRTEAELRARGLDQDMSLVRRLAWVDRDVVRLPGMRHADFAIHAMIEAIAPAFWGPVNGAPAEQYPRLAETIRLFLDLNVAGRRAARADLDAGVRALGGERLAAGAASPAFAPFAAQALTGGNVVSANSDAALAAADEASLVRLASELLYRRGEAAAARRIAEIGLRRFPASSSLASISSEAER